MLKTATSDQKYKSEGVLCSKEALREKLWHKSYKKGSLFAGREVKIRSNYTVKDRFLEMVYDCTGNKKGIKTLRESYYREYVLKKLVKLISRENLSDENKGMLRNLVQQTSIFQKVNKIVNISCETVLAIHGEIEVEPIFIDKTTKKGLVEEGKEKKVEKAKKELVETELIRKASELYDIAKWRCRQGNFFEATEFYNQIIELYTYQRLDESIVLKALQKLDEIYHKAYIMKQVHNRCKKYPSSDTGLVDLCMRKHYYYLAIVYCEEILVRIKKIIHIFTYVRSNRA